MKPMIWQPEADDRKVNSYLEKVNHAPYALIALLTLLSICGITLLFLMGTI